MKKSKISLLGFLLLFLVSLPSFSEERKIHLTETEYTIIMNQLQTALIQLNELKTEQNQDLMKLNQDFKKLSEYCKEQEKEAKKKMMVTSIVGFSAGVVFASGIYILVKK